MEITIETGSYNERRMGRPWIAIVDFSQSAKGEFNWGDWTGDHYNGGAGILSISANPGDIVAKGQKDNRQPRNSAPDFYVVCADGKLSSIGDKGAAYKHYLANKTSVPDTDTLTKERKDAAFKALLEAARYVVRWHREHDSGEGELFGLDYVTTCIAAIRKAEGVQDAETD